MLAPLSINHNYNFNKRKTRSTTDAAVRSRILHTIIFTFPLRAQASTRRRQIMMKYRGRENCCDARVSARFREKRLVYNPGNLVVVYEILRYKLGYLSFVVPFGKTRFLERCCRRLDGWVGGQKHRVTKIGAHAYLITLFNCAGNNITTASSYFRLVANRHLANVGN